MFTDTPSFFPVNGAGKEGLTTAGKELALHCIATTLVLLLAPHEAEQPNVKTPIFIKPNQLTTKFSMVFLLGGMQYVIAAAVTNVVHSNTHSYTASKRYITQVQI